METIKIGTRGSKLALWQAHNVAEKLESGGLSTEIITIDTKGDKILDVSIAKIGSKGVFTEEIEDQLREGHIDIAVHSAKDMQSVLPDGFEIIAFMEREIVNDVLVSTQKNIDLTNPDLVLGTSSTRRVALFKHFYPNVNTVPVRGNLQTRIAKMKDGACDALVLAYAGMHRMGYSDMIVKHMPLNQFIPAVGQGSVAIECYEGISDEKRTQVRECLNHKHTELRLLTERAFLRELEGGCSIPVFALATLASDQLSIEGGIVDLNGKEIIKKEISGSSADAEKIGLQLAQDILAAGGDQILKEIKEDLNKE